MISINNSKDSLKNNDNQSDKLIFDPSRLLKLVNNNKEMAIRFIHTFLGDDGYLKYIYEIKNAIDEKNAEKLHNEAHTLKGMIGYFSDSGIEITLKLQEMGRSKDLSSANDTYKDLIEILKRLVPLLKEFIGCCK